MFAQLLAIGLAGAAAQAAGAQSQGASAAAPAELSTLATTEELKRLHAQLPKASKRAKLLNAGEIANHMDYPREALVAAQQGAVLVWLLVAADGRVEKCGIEEGSGSALLDTQTCDLFVANGRFRPAQGKSGRPIASIFHQRMVWRLRDGGSAVTVKNMILRETYVVGPEGEVRSCKTEYRVAAAQWAEGPPCPGLPGEADAIFLAARADSKLHDAELVLESRVFTDPAEAMPPVGRGAGEVLVYLQAATMRFAADGKRIGCTIVETYGSEGFREDACASTRYAQAPASEVKAGRAAGEVRFLWAIYLKGEPK